eukprot:2757985-Amphidinium_carterae.1
MSRLVRTARQHQDTILMAPDEPPCLREAVKSCRKGYVRLGPESGIMMKINAGLCCVILSTIYQGLVSSSLHTQPAVEFVSPMADAMHHISTYSTT